MGRDTITGSRIRERRVMVGLKQADLARLVGISASYLNLIEHNRRRIGGKLLVDIAASLGVEPSALTEGAEAALIQGLHTAAANVGPGTAELDRVEEFAARFPGWAGLLTGMSARLDGLEQSIATLSDRLAHDPHLATSLHEVLSQVTAIRSTAAILADTQELEPEWRDRFHRNINEDSRKLAESSQALAAYLDGAGDAGADINAPQEEIDAFMQARAYHMPELEQPGATVETMDATVRNLTTREGRAGLRAVLTRYLQDAQAMPLAAVLDVLQNGIDPSAVMARFNVSPAAALRRIACLPTDALPSPVGLVVCDGSGALLFRKPVDGFAMPLFGAACPLWPLYQALSGPLTPISTRLEMSGRDHARFNTHSVAMPRHSGSFDMPPLLEATMLILPDRRPDAGPARPVGSNCRICPRRACVGRREASLIIG